MANTRFRSLGFWVLVVLIFVGEASLSWAQVESNPVVVRATKHVVVPPLSQIGRISAESERSTPLLDDDMLLMHERRATRPVRDSVLQQSSAATTFSALVSSSNIPSTNPGLNILGEGTGFPGYTVNNNTSDTNAAVGTTQVVQFVNDSFAVFNKSNGSLAFGPAKGYTLWQALGGACAASPNLDEIVEFDQFANRWVMMMPVFTAPEYFCFAVSTTSDAVNGGWNLYAFEEPGNPICNCRMQPDYPKVGVWPDGYYLTYNQGWNGNFEGPAACVVDRNSMLSGAAATMQCFNRISATYGTLVPSDLDGGTPPPAGSPAYFLNFDYSDDQSLDLWRFHVDWTTPTNSTFTGPTNIPVAPFTEACGETVTELNYTTGACMPQTGTTQGLDSYGDRLMYRLAYRNFGTHESLVTNHTVTTGANGSQTGIRWYELQSTGTGFARFQQGTYAPDTSYRWMGSIAMDKAGDIAMGYSVSSPTMSPSIGYAGRLFSDPLGQMGSEVDALSSAGIPHGSRTNNFRWSDYSSLAIDPTDDCTFWYTAEYMPANGGNWSTRLVSFNFPSCTQSATLTVGEVGHGTVTSTDGTINCTNSSGTCVAPYALGSSVTMNATAAAGWTFSGWSGACSGGNPCNLVMNSNLTTTATFKQNFTLTVNEVSQGTVTSSDGAINCTNGTGTCSAVYKSGTSVALNATAGSGLTFLGWSGACSGANPCNLVMNSNLTATATFGTGLPNYTLTVNEVGHGTVTSTDGAINCTNGSGTCSAVYVSGSSVTLNASAATGSTFMGWSGPCSGHNACNLTMNGNVSATATFVTTPSWSIVHRVSRAGAITNITILPTGSQHLIAVAMMFNGSTSVTRVSDNAGNAYVSAGARAVAGTNSVEIWYAQNSVAGATLITPTFANAPPSLEITVWEVSGVLSLPPDDTNTAAGSVTSSTVLGPAVTTTQAGDFVISVILGLNVSFPGTSTGNEFTNDFKTFGNGWAHITSNSSSAGTHRASWITSAPSGGYCASTVAFAP